MKSTATLRPKKLFRWLTWHRNLEQAVKSLSNQQLRVMNGYLAKAGDANGIPSLIHGLILNEAAGRLMAGKDKGKEHAIW